MRGNLIAALDIGIGQAPFGKLSVLRSNKRNRTIRGAPCRVAIPQWSPTTISQCFFTAPMVPDRDPASWLCVLGVLCGNSVELCRDKEK